MQFFCSKISDKGGRNENQDSCSFISEGDNFCAIMADGLGGHKGGQKASSIAVETISNYFRKNPNISSDNITDYVKKAQDQIVYNQNLYSELSSMRTTIVVLLCNGNKAIWLHMGDSRLYFFRKGKIIKQTKDHSVPQIMFSAGDIHKSEIRGHVDRNRLLRTLGKEDEFKPVIHNQIETILEGDAFLLCSDGFWDYIVEPEMEADLLKTDDPEKWLMEMKVRILKRAEGDFDNYSAIAVLIK